MQGELSTDAEERQEAARHDALYRTQRPSDLFLSAHDWEKFDHFADTTDPYIASIQLLGDVRGRRVLDAGCGDGWLSVILAKRGAFVEGFDISQEAVSTARARALANGVEGQCHFEVASFYALPYSDMSFDLVVGQAILHHVRDKSRVAAELHRVMASEGRAVFKEPFGNSLMFERLRLLVPVPSQAEDDPTEWRKQLKYVDLEPFKPLFEICMVEWHLFSRLDRVIHSRWFRKKVGQIDRSLLRGVPFLRKYARVVVIELTRRLNALPEAT